MRDWIELVCGTLGAQHALIVASDGELAIYDPRLERTAPRGQVGAASCVSRVASLTASGALGSVLACFRAASGRRLLVCCPSGQARTGTLGALWLHRTLDVSLELAAREVSQTTGTIRRPSLADLIACWPGRARRGRSRWLGRGHGRGRVEHVQAELSAALRRARTARVAHPHDWRDKDSPRITGGYAFEIAQPAVVDMLGELAQIGALGFAYRVLSICRKDSQDVTKEDREAMVAACKSNARFSKVVSTHGTDTMVETAELLEAALGYADTGATSTREGQTIVIVRISAPSGAPRELVWLTRACKDGRRTALRLESERRAVQPGGRRRRAGRQR